MVMFPVISAVPLPSMRAVPEGVDNSIRLSLVLRGPLHKTFPFTESSCSFNVIPFARYVVRLLISGLEVNVPCGIVKEAPVVSAGLPNTISVSGVVDMVPAVRKIGASEVLNVNIFVPILNSPKERIREPLIFTGLVRLTPEELFITRLLTDSGKPFPVDCDNVPL